jgi:hypothetical protein
MPVSAARSALICLLAGSTGLAAFTVPASAQSAPERGVFVTQIGESSRTNVTQRNADSLTQIVQDGDGNQIDLAQTGSAAHRAQIAQDGDGNTVSAEQDGDGTTILALAQEGDANTAILLQRELSSAGETTAAVVQRGNGNTIILAQDGSDNSASLEQTGDSNTMTATQLNSGNRLEWSQTGDGLADLGIVQTGNGNLQVTQSVTGAQFAPAPGSGG